MGGTAEKIVKIVGLHNIYKVFKLIRSVYMAIDFICCSLFGYSLVNGWKHEQQLAQARVDKSGNLVRILGRGTSNPAGTCTLHHFILRHEAYVDPISFIINNDNVTLMGVSADQAWFSVSTKTDVYGLGRFPFAFMAQFFSSDKLLLVNISTLHQIANKIGKPSGNCILINNTGRCGSTLLCQMFRKLPNTLVMSEPWGLLYIHQLYNLGKVTWDDYQELIRSCIKIQFKPTQQVQSERYILKLPLFCSPMMHSIHELFGEKIKIILSTRLPKPSMLSFAKVFSQVDKSNLAYFWFVNLGMPYTPKYRALFEKYFKQRKSASMGVISAIGYASVMAEYLMHKSIYKHAVIYEEMTSDVSTEASKLFDVLGIPSNMVSQALTALKKHSQNNMFGSSELNTEDLLTELDWRDAEVVFKELEVPIEVAMHLQDLSNMIH